MTVEEKLQWLESRKGSNHPLESFRAFVDETVPGWHDLKMIQVAGTNGKGSTIQWMLQMADTGKVGTFTSPHLVSHFERMQINGQNIPAETWESLFDQSLIEAHDLTMFEADLWMALRWFVDENVDLVLVETGLGGRKDAATALDYAAAGITNIGLDHMAILGNTLEEIAKEKAGILKAEVPAATTEKELFPVLQREKPDLEFVLPEKVTGLPAYQAANKALAKKLLELARVPVRKTDDAEFFWPGRWHAIRQSPLLLVDGAHNLPGIEALVQSHPEVDQIYFSVLADKQGRQMLERLQTLHVPVQLVHFDQKRLADLEALGAVLSFEQMMADLKDTRKRTLVCGSLYFVAEVLKRQGELA